MTAGGLSLAVALTLELMPVILPASAHSTWSSSGPFDGAWQQYKYDATNRLAEVYADGASQPMAKHFYGASNQRLRSEESGWKTWFVWGNGATLAEYGESAGALSWAKSYVYLGARLLATQMPGGISYHHADRLGTRLTTDTASGQQSEQAHLPFGAALGAESSGVATNRRFTSYERSTTTQLDYAVNRFYSAGLGRFTQVDPIGMQAASLANPQSLNLYGYCGNDPVNHLDPDGLFWRELFQAIINFFTGNRRNNSPGATTPPFNPNAGVPGFGGSGGRSGGGIRGATPPFNPNAGTGIGGVSRISSYLAQQGSGRVRLSGERLSAFLSAAQRLLELLKDKNSDCAKFLRSKLGPGGSRVARAVQGQPTFDGTLSTVSTKDAGIQPKRGLFSEFSVKGFFEATKAYAAPAYLYATPDDRGARLTDVYYGAEGINTSNILHETLHHFLGLTDTQLYDKLGIDRDTRDSKGTVSISEALANAGCK